MSVDEITKYFDLYTTGIGYLNRVHEVAPSEGSPFLSITISALRGSAKNLYLLSINLSGLKKNVSLSGSNWRILSDTSKTLMSGL